MAMDNANWFNTSGKIPTMANFWKQSVDAFVTGNGLTPKFQRVIAEQSFKPLGEPDTPFYNHFAGRPLNAGAGWTERALEYQPAKHFNPKAGATEELSFYENSGIEKTFVIDYEGWRPTSIPSDMYNIEEFVEARGVDELSSQIVDAQTKGYQMDVESALEKKAISCCASEVEVDITDMTALYNTIRDTSADMMGDTVHYNELTTAENADIITHANEVLAFMPLKLWNQLRSSRASLPSPSELVDNVTVIPTLNPLPTPITTAEWSTSPSTGITWADKPAGIDKAKPEVYLVDARKIEYRPVIRSYNTGMVPVHSGNRFNFHMTWRGACGVRPWYNHVRIIAESGGA